MSDIVHRGTSHIVITSLIFVFGIVAAVVCFGLLKSEASVDGPYAAGGAFAGAVISWGVLTSVYLQVFRSGTELDALRTRAEELQQKLIRGSPRPTGFEVEVDEHQRIVLARPGDWEPRGGTIFDYQSTSLTSPRLDPFPARFRAYYLPIVVADQDRSKSAEQRQREYYELLRTASSDEYLTAHSTEIMHLGDPPGGVKSLRFTSQNYARVWRQRDPLTGREDWQYKGVTRSEFLLHVQTTVDRAIRHVLRHMDDVGERAAKTSEIRPTVTERFMARLEQGTCDPAAGLFEEIEAYLREELGLGEGNDPTSAGQKASMAAGGARQGAGVNSDPAAALAAQEVRGSPEPSLEDRVEIVPIGRILVVCYHDELARIYFFEVMDNASDYTESSEKFNRILSSVRFLG